MFCLSTKYLINSPWIRTEMQMTPHLIVFLILCDKWCWSVFRGRARQTADLLCVFEAPEPVRDSLWQLMDCVFPLMWSRSREPADGRRFSFTFCHMKRCLWCEMDGAWSPQRQKDVMNEKVHWCPRSTRNYRSNWVQCSWWAEDDVGVLSFSSDIKIRVFTSCHTCAQLVCVLILF